MDQTQPIEPQIIRSLTDEAIGERRQIMIAPDGRALSLRLHRWSAAGKRARWGETYVARVRTVDKQRRGAYLDLGLKDEGGFLSLNNSGGVRFKDNAIQLNEGMLIAVSVAREAARGKQPVLRLIDPAPQGESAPRLLDTPDKPFNASASPDLEMRALIDAAIDEALSIRTPIPGGGALTIEPTSALVAIDVDAEGRRGSGDPERFARELNVAAALEAVRQIRLRSLGGLIAIDFVSMRAEESRKAVAAALKIALNTLPWEAQIAPMSRFGVIEIAIAQLLTPINEIVRNTDPETAALNLLRGIEREAGAYGGRRILACAAPDIADWLAANHIGWRDALTSRIGARFEIKDDPALRSGRFDVSAL